MNATPKIDISDDSVLSTSKPVRSANNWQIKLFLDTPPSTLQHFQVGITISNVTGDVIQCDQPNFLVVALHLFFQYFKSENYAKNDAF